jgi:hypothetical protein
MNNNKNLWISIGIVVLFVVGLIIWSGNKDAMPTADETASTEDVSDGSVNAVPGATPAASLSYNQALVQYKDKRIQLDQTCIATPNNVTFKSGTNIMLDNRANVARTIVVGETSYSIKKYGFKIVKISSAIVPKTITLDCGTSKNVGTIIIQK